MRRVAVEKIAYLEYKGGSKFSPRCPMAKISFVCPLFNKAPYLQGVVAAMEQQALGHDRQFIFIDDGSIDGSLDIVKDLTKGWADCHYRYQDNTGPSGSTNAGFALADGDYVKLVGSDDILAPFATDLLLRSLQETGAVAVYSHQHYYAKPEEVVFDAAQCGRKAVRHDDGLALVIGRTISGTSQTLFDMNAVRKAGGCDRRVFAEDFSLALRLALQGPIATLDAVTAFGPAGEGERIMVARKHQVFHDYNLAMQLFLEDHPDLPARYVRLALQRAAGRAEKWVRREGGGEASALPYQLLRLRGYLPFGRPLSAMERTLAAFEVGPIARQRSIIRPKQA